MSETFKKYLIFDSIDKTINLKTNEICEIYLINIISPKLDISKVNTCTEFNTNLNVNLDESGSTVKIYQIGIANHISKITTNINIIHNNSNCKSEVISKFILEDKNAQTNWIGNVCINKGAINTQTFEENRNLILETGAIAQSEPNLEIFEGDILEAKHASSSTRPDDEELFYIMSRGINMSNAKKLIIDAFINDIINKMNLSEEERGRIYERINY